jgi:hypothetical protein
MKDREESQVSQTEHQALVPDALKDKGLESPLEEESATIRQNALRPVPVTDSERLMGFVDGGHEYVREFIGLADQKAGFLFATTAAMLVYLYHQGALGLWWTPIDLWGVMSFGAFVATAALFASANCAVLVVWPCLKGSTEGMLFWKAIAAYSSQQEYLARLHGLSDEALVDQKAGHLYELAVICDRKYRWVNRSTWFGATGLLLSILLVVVGLS